MQPHLIAATNAAYTAATYLLNRQQLASRLMSNDDMNDFLAETEEKAREIILEKLQEAFPSIPCVSEVSGYTVNPDKMVWIVNPIDGAVNYFLQKSEWGVSIALRQENLICSGTITFPAHNDMFYLDKAPDAPRYEVCRNNKPFEVARRIYQPQETRFNVAWTDRIHNELASDLEVTRRLYEASSYPTCTMCGIWDIRSVLLGYTHGVAFRRPHLVHMTAAAIIARVAGCNVTKFDGTLWEPGSSLLCTRISQYQHKEIVKTLTGV